MRALIIDFSQEIAYDTSRIRVELGYREIVPEEEGVQRTLASVSSKLTRPSESRPHGAPAHWLA